MRAHSHPAKVNSSKTTSYEQFFHTITTIGMNLENRLKVKDVPINSKRYFQFKKTK